MPPETNEQTPLAEPSVDLFAEPRDHANQWDVSNLWPDSKPSPIQKERAQAADAEEE